MSKKWFLQGFLSGSPQRRRSYRIVKMISLWLFLFACSLNAENLLSMNARITLKKGNSSLEQIMDEIEKQSHYLFVYTKDVNIQQVYTVNMKSATLRETLDGLFTGTEVRYDVEGAYIVLSAGRHAPPKQADVTVLQQSDKRITGTVVDEKGESVIGANIVEKGVVANGTVTDVNGSFTLNVQPGARLTVSFIGYVTQEIAVGNQSNLKIILVEDTRALEEVVVVGYGTQKKVTLTGSVVTAKGEDIVKTPTGNVLNALAGRLPGVIINNRSGEPGRDNTSMFIRGRSTTGNTSALIIIDGVDRGDLANINPNDIENISVLKDASAAIYGAQAANGVILVTTKRGASAKPVISFSYNQGFSQPTRKPIMADSYTFFTVYNEIEASEGRPPRYSDEELQKFKEGVDPDYANIDWYDYITKDWTPQHRTYVSISGSGERAKYYLSLGEFSQDDIYHQGDRKYRQYTIRSNVDVKLSEYLTVGVNLAGRYEKREAPYTNARGLNSHIFLYQPNWLPYWPGTNYLKPNRDNESILNMVNNNAGFRKENFKTVSTTIFFNWQIPWVKGLTIEGSGNYDAGHTFSKDMRIPTYVYYQESDGSFRKGLAGSSVALAMLTDRGNFSDQSYLTVKATYEKSVGRHNLGAMIGYEQYKAGANNLEAHRKNFLSPSIQQVFGGSTDPAMQSNNGSASQGARQNMFGRLNYDYAGKYLAQFTMRRDGSPNFPKEKRFGYFPSASAGWRLSEESFMKDVDGLDNLKIRGSYGVMGNDRVGAFQYMSTYGYGRNYVIGGTVVSGLQETAIPNPNITWETAKTWDVGLESTLWGGLLGIEFDWFKTRRSDILRRRSATIPTHTGLSLPDENIGIVDNKGFELILTHANTVNDFKYSISGNVSFARNKVVYIDEQPAAEPYQYATGRPIDASLLYKSLGIFKDQAAIDNYPHLPGTVPGDIIYEDVNKDGVIDSRDRIRVDLTNVPEIVFGLNVNLQYKGFDLSVLFQGQENAKQGFGGYEGGWFPVMSYSFGNFMAWRAKDRWSPSNTDATMPRASAALWNNSTNSVYNSTHWMKSAGFLRLKNVELGYHLPKRICSQVGIQDLRFSVNASNLFMIYDHMKDLGFDPETTVFWYYQQLRTWNFGINLTY